MTDPTPPAHQCSSACADDPDCPVILRYDLAAAEARLAEAERGKAYWLDQEQAERSLRCAAEAERDRQKAMHRDTLDALDRGGRKLDAAEARVARLEAALRTIMESTPAMAERLAAAALGDEP